MISRYLVEILLLFKSLFLSEPWYTGNSKLTLVISVKIVVGVIITKEFLTCLWRYAYLQGGAKNGTQVLFFQSPVRLQNETILRKNVSWSPYELIASS